MKYILYFIFLVGMWGCHSDSIVQKEEKERKEPLANDKIVKLVEQLASPKFFEHTQAARELIQMGKEALPYLTKEMKTVRETNDSILPVCMIVIKIIFQQQDLPWVISQTENPSEEIRKIAQEEIAKRNQARTNTEKK